LVHYETFDKRKIPAWYYPPAEKTAGLPPVIVYPHGGPESQTRPNFSISSRPATPSSRRTCAARRATARRT
jgi:dipeptidyl aminopeptidase/acylaminoacyl peptidase